MSRSKFSKPVFRLVFDASSARLYGPGGGDPLRTVGLGAPDLPAALGSIGAQITRSRGRVTVELPPSEVWSAPSDPNAGAVSRWRSARRAASRELGVPARGLCLSVADRRAAVAMQRTTLRQTRAYLAAAGLDVTGFSASTAAGTRVEMGPSRLEPWHGGVACAAFLAAAAFFGPWSTGEPALDEPLAASAHLTAVEPADPVKSITTPEEIAARVLPRSRPAAKETAREAPAPTSVSGTEPKTAPSAAPAPAPAPAIVKAAREVPGIADRAASRAPVSAAPPLRRPQPGAVAALGDPAAASVKAAGPEPAASAPGVGAGPLRRPGRPVSPKVEASEAETAAPPLKESSEASLAPRPRAATMASATPLAPQEATQPAASSAAQAVAPAPSAVSAPRPEPRRIAARPAPARAPAQAVVFQTHAPTVIRTAAPNPAVIRPAAKPAEPAQIAAPKPARQSAAVSAPASAGAPARTRSGLQRNRVSLLGVFGASPDRHALVQMPNGRVYRVSAGDRLDGAQVASVTGDSVHLTGRGTNVVLTLP